MHERVNVTFSIETFNNYTNKAKQELTTLIKYAHASLQSMCFNDMLKVGKITWEVCTDEDASECFFVTMLLTLDIDNHVLLIAL